MYMYMYIYICLCNTRSYCRFLVKDFPLLDNIIIRYPFSALEQDKSRQRLRFLKRTSALDS